MSALIDLSVRDFIRITASDAPAPGGGSISAMAGAVGAALVSMVAALTIGKEKYREAEAEMQNIREEASRLQEELLAAVDRDTESFNQYMEALKLPKSTEEERAIRSAALQEGLKAAALVPLSAAETALKVLPLAKAAVKRGNSGAVTDALVAAMMARSCVLGACLNTRINLSSIRDEAFTSEAGAKAEVLVRAVIAEEEEIFRLHRLTADFSERADSSGGS